MGASRVFGSREVEALMDGVSGISGSNRDKLMSAVQNGELQNIVNELYRPGQHLVMAVLRLLWHRSFMKVHQSIYRKQKIG